MPNIQLPNCISDWEVDLDCFRNRDNEIEYSKLHNNSTFYMTFNVKPRGTSRLDLFEGYGRLSASMGYQALYVTLFGNRFDIFSVSMPLDRSVVKLHAYAYNLEYHTAQRIAVDFYSLLTSVPEPRGAMQNYRHPVIHYIDHETREPWYAKALTFLESLMPL